MKLGELGPGVLVFEVVGVEAKDEGNNFVILIEVNLGKLIITKFK